MGAGNQLGSISVDEILELSTDWIWKIDGDLRFVFLSDRMTEITGIPAEHALGKGIAELVGDPDSDAVLAHLEDLKEHRPFHGFVTDLRGPDGRTIWCKFSGKPRFDDDGSFTGYLGCASSATAQLESLDAARQRNEDLAMRVRKAETQLETAFGLMSEGVVIHDADNRVVMCNEAFRQMHPRLADAVVPGAPLEDVLRHGLKNGEWDVDPENWDEWIVNRSKIYEAPQSESVVHTVDGRITLSRTRRADDGMFVIARTDVTELKRHEEELASMQYQLSSIFSGMDAGLVVYELDADGELIVEMCSARAIELLDLPEGMMSPGQKQEVFTSFFTERGDFDKSKEVAGNENGRKTLRIEHSLADEKYVLATSVIRSNGSVIVTYTDITEAKQREAERATAVEMAEIADRAK